MMVDMINVSYSIYLYFGKYGEDQLPTKLLETRQILFFHGI